MSRISSKFSNGHKALIGYLTVGYPDIATTVKAAKVLEKGGCDIIELGIPFSDPIGDGPVIQAASYRALQNGVTPAICLEVASTISREVKTPLIFMGYYNTILSYGLKRFCRESAAASINGLIIPDLPPDESKELKTAASEFNLDVIYLLAPTSTPERIFLIAQESQGFIYLTSVAGVTGVRDVVPSYLPEFIDRVRCYSNQPLVIGFGVSSARHAGEIAQHAEGVIIGSQLLRLIENDPSLNQLLQFVEQVCSQLNPTVQVP